MSQMDSSPSTPPMTPDHAPMAEPPVWPKVIGIISIVLGSLGLPCSVCVSIVTFSMGPFLQWAGSLQQQNPGSGGGAQIPSTPIPSAFSPGIASILSAVMWPVCAVMMIVAGIVLIRRKPLGRTLHLAYAALSLAGTLLGLLGAWLTQASATAFIASQPDDPWSKLFSSQGSGPAGQFVQALLFSCVAIVYPAFVLIWFGMVKRKASDMGGALTEPLV